MTINSLKLLTALLLTLAYVKGTVNQVGEEESTSNQESDNSADLPQDGSSALRWFAKSSQELHNKIERVEGARILDLNVGKGIVVVQFSDADIKDNFLQNPQRDMQFEPDYPRYSSNVDKFEVQGIDQAVPWGIDKVFRSDIPTSLPWNYSKAVCIIDSGYQLDHPDLPNATYADPTQKETFSTDDCGHGTHIAGTILAENNEIGVFGVYPGISPKIVKVFGAPRCMWTYSSTLMHAINQCQQHGAKVINLSLGGGIHTNAERRFMQQKYIEGILFVAAAGNGGVSEYYYPGSYPSVISVGATTRDDDIASFSQFNSQVDISAPGVNIQSTEGNGYSFKSGTSMASSHVSGVATLLWNWYPECTNIDIRTALMHTSEDKGTTGRDDYFGNGIVDYHAAYNYLKNSPCGAQAAPTPSPTTCTGCRAEIKILTDDHPGDITWKLKRDDVTHITGGPYAGINTEYVHNECLTEAEYKFQIFDSVGDGLNPDGNYQVYLDGALKVSMGVFTSFNEHTFECKLDLVPTSEPNNQTITFKPSPQSSIVPSSTPHVVKCQKRSFDATRLGMRRGYGYYFDVIVLADIEISGIGIHAADLTSSVHVWTKTATGTYEGSEVTQNNWVLAQTLFDVSGSGIGRIVDLPEFDIPLSLRAGTRQAFRIVSNESNLFGRSVEKRQMKDADDGVLSLFSGEMTFTPGDFVQIPVNQNSYVWNGRLNYCILSNVLRSPTQSPTYTNLPTTAFCTVMTLNTQYHGITSAYGNYFDVMAVRGIKIVGLRIHSFVDIDEIRIYSRQGGYSGFEMNSNQWQLVHTQSSVQGAGFQVYTDLEAFGNPVKVAPGTKQAFLVISSKRNLLTRSLQPNGVGYVSDQSLIIYSGPITGHGQAFVSAMGAYAFNGSVRYCSL